MIGALSSQFRGLGVYTIHCLVWLVPVK